MAAAANLESTFRIEWIDEVRALEIKYAKATGVVRPAN
jgi:hypothetical protein